MSDVGGSRDVLDIAGLEDPQWIGRGGFAEVYRAYQRRFDRVIAVKLLNLDLLDERAQRRFLRECAAMGRLTGHPNIVTLLESGVTDRGRPYLLMNYMERGSLAQQIEATGPMHWPEVLRTGVKICGALESAHQAGILHRDIKPQNVLVPGYDEPALTDFGIATVLDNVDLSVSFTGWTPLHTPPELLQADGQHPSEATDVYALGSTLYTLLAGRAPFQGPPEENIGPLLFRIIRDPVPPIEAQAIPAQVNEILLATLAKDPVSRPQSARQLGEALREAQIDQGQYPTEMVIWSRNRDERDPDRTRAHGAPGWAGITPGGSPRPPLPPGVEGTPPGQQATAGPATADSETHVSQPGTGPVRPFPSAFDPTHRAGTPGPPPTPPGAGATPPGADDAVVEILAETFVPPAAPAPPAETYVPPAPACPPASPAETDVPPAADRIPERPADEPGPVGPVGSGSRRRSATVAVAVVAAVIVIAVVIGAVVVRRGPGGSVAGTTVPTRPGGGITAVVGVSAKPAPPQIRYSGRAADATWTYEQAGAKAQVRYHPAGDTAAAVTSPALPVVTNPLGVDGLTPGTTYCWTLLITDEITSEPLESEETCVPPTPSTP